MKNCASQCYKIKNNKYKNTKVSYGFVYWLIFIFVALFFIML